MASSEPGAVHAFAQAAFFKEVAFGVGGLAVEQAICLMDKTDEDVGDYLGGASFDEGPEILEVCVAARAEPASVTRLF
jgi:hypothetical protein